jgi:hypothetical protein
MGKHEQEGFKVLRRAIEVFEADFVKVTGKQRERNSAFREPNDGTQGVSTNSTSLPISASWAFRCKVLVGSKYPNLDRSLIKFTTLFACQVRLKIDLLLAIEPIELIQEIIPGLGTLRRICVEPNSTDLDCS